MTQNTHVEEGSLEDLIPDSHNANAGTDYGDNALGESIGKLKLGRGILTDYKNRIIAGNKTYAKAGELDAVDGVIIVDTDGTKLVVTRRTDLDLDEIGGKGRQMAHMDNLVNQASFNPDMVKTIQDIMAMRGEDGNIPDDNPLPSVISDKKIRSSAKRIMAEHQEQVKEQKEEPITSGQGSLIEQAVQSVHDTEEERAEEKQRELYKVDVPSVRKGQLVRCGKQYFYCGSFVDAYKQLKKTPLKPYFHSIFAVANFPDGDHKVQCNLDVSEEDPSDRYGLHAEKIYESTVVELLSDTGNLLVTYPGPMMIKQMESLFVLHDLGMDVRQHFVCYHGGEDIDPEETGALSNQHESVYLFSRDGVDPLFRPNAVIPYSPAKTGGSSIYPGNVLKYSKTLKNSIAFDEEIILKFFLHLTTEKTDQILCTCLGNSMLPSVAHECERVGFYCDSNARKIKAALGFLAAHSREKIELIDP